MYIPIDRLQIQQGQYKSYLLTSDKQIIKSIKQCVNTSTHKK